MATQRLSNVLSHITPGKSPLEQMYASKPSPQRSPDRLDHHNHKSAPFANNISPNSTSQNPDDVVITLAIRTPLTKAKKGGFKDTPLDGLVFKILEQVVRKSRLDPQMVEDICLGNVCRTPRHQQYTR